MKEARDKGIKCSICCDALVMWRPGKLRFLIGMKTRFLFGRL
jgi:hypothetical protein